MAWLLQVEERGSGDIEVPCVGERSIGYMYMVSSWEGNRTFSFKRGSAISPSGNVGAKLYRRNMIP